MSRGQPRNVRTKGFKEQLLALSDGVQDAAKTAFGQFREDPTHTSLRHKLLKNKKQSQHRPESYSVSVTLRYRALYVKDGDTNVWYWIGSHADYNNFTGSSKK